ncbi:MAG: alpha/beta hydrolase [Rhodospirillales bacterium]
MQRRRFPASHARGIAAPRASACEGIGLKRGSETNMSDVVWQGLTTAELDRQFNLRARWPSHEAAFSRWSQSSAVQRQTGTWLELTYGDDPLQRIDLALPDRPAAGGPLLVFVHGGYWQSLDKGDFSFPAPAFLEAGIAYASLNYRLAPAVRLQEIAGDVAAALDCLRSQAPRHGLAEDGIVIAGHSAGGHLALVELLRDRLAVAETGAPPRFAAACSISGIYDLAPVRLSYQQPLLRVSTTEVLDLSPLRQAPLSAPPLLLVVGDRETAEFVRQQDALASLWRDLDLPVESRRLAGADHFTVVDGLADAADPLTVWLIEACLTASHRRTV